MNPDVCQRLMYVKTLTFPCHWTEDVVVSGDFLLFVNFVLINMDDEIFLVPINTCEHLFLWKEKTK